jgi:hypothetical protein
MKQITIVTTNNGVIKYFVSDEEAQSVKERMQDGLGHLSFSSTESVSWVNIQNVVQLMIGEPEKPKTEETEKAKEEETQS